MDDRAERKLKEQAENKSEIMRVVETIEQEYELSKGEGFGFFKEDLELVGKGLEYSETFNDAARVLGYFLKDKTIRDWPMRMLARALPKIEGRLDQGNENALIAAQFFIRIFDAYAFENHQYEGKEWGTIMLQLFERHRESILPLLSSPPADLPERDLFRRLDLIPHFAYIFPMHRNTVEDSYIAHFAEVFWRGLTPGLNMWGPALYGPDNLQKALNRLDPSPSIDFLFKIYAKLFDIRPTNFGRDPKEVFSEFSETLTPKESLIVFFDELAAMRRLARRESKAVKALFEQCGIRYFSRYDTEFLLRRYHELQKAGPSLVVSNALGDLARSFGEMNKRNFWQIGNDRQASKV